MLNDINEVKATGEVLERLVQMYDEVGNIPPVHLKKYIRRWLIRSFEVPGESFCKNIGINFDLRKKYFMNADFFGRSIYFECIPYGNNFKITGIGWIEDDVWLYEDTAANPPLPPDKVSFSEHAKQRFKERIKNNSKLKIGQDLDELMRKIFAGSSAEEISPSERVKRLLDHGFVDTLHFRNRNWRFVVVEEKGFYRVVTIVRI